MGVTHFTCQSLGVAGTTEVYVQETKEGYEARVGIAIMGSTNMKPEVLATMSPFDPEFHDNYATGKGKTKEEALENLKKDIAVLSNSIFDLVERNPMLDLLKRIHTQGLEQARNDHDRETVNRAFAYAKNRIADGLINTDNELKLAFSGFADGFCTGVHATNGTVCEH